MGLSKDSATYQKHLGDDAGWDINTDLLAGAVNLLATLNFAFAKANGAKDMKPPKLVSRPSSPMEDEPETKPLSELTSIFN